MEQTDLEELYVVSELVIQTSSQVYHEMRDIKGWTKEVFVAFYLDSRHKIISREIVAIGTLDMAIVHPREIFRTAILRNAAAIIIAHNHPSGATDPSMEDTSLTDTVREAGRVIGIQVLDHVIVSNDGFYSFADRGRI